MNLQLDGKRALVSGSTAGIGFAIAEALARKARGSSSAAAPRSRSMRRERGLPPRRRTRSMASPET